MEFSHATIQDAIDIANLHARSWQQHYRGIYSDEYLDKEVFSERQAFWKARMETPTDNQLVILAKKGDQLCGFVCIFTDYDAQWGAYVDNLHVAPEVKNLGIGRQLMQKAVDWLRTKNADSKFYLWVFEANVAAQHFYDKIGGKPIGIEPFSLEKHGGGVANAVRYVWNE